MQVFFSHYFSLKNMFLQVDYNGVSYTWICFLPEKYTPLCKLTKIVGWCLLPVTWYLLHATCYLLIITYYLILACTCYLIVSLWYLLSETCYHLPKIVSFRSCSATRSCFSSVATFSHRSARIKKPRIGPLSRPCRP